MKLYDVRHFLEDNNIKEILSIVKSSRKNQMLDMFLDYYDGVHWKFKSSDSVDESSYLQRSNTTRSGRQMWENKDRKSPHPGFSKGELKVWNLCDSTVNIYSSYARGNINDRNRVEIEDHDKLAQTVNDKLGDLDNLIIRCTHRMSIDSVAVIKYQDGGTIEVLDAREIFPIYEGDKHVGTIRAYELSRNNPILQQVDIQLKKDEAVTYMEIWIPDEGDRMLLRKFVNDVEIDPSKTIAPYTFDPHIIIPNKNHEFRDFDENNIEVSDVDNIIPIQDDLNAFITDISLVNRSVAMPMWKLATAIYEKMANGEINSKEVRNNLENLSLISGNIIAAPLERDAAQGIPSTSLQYLDEIYNQLYRISGIPKTVYISEGLGNIATKTIEHLMESLRRRVDEKRTNIENGIREYVSMLVGQAGINDKINMDEVKDAVTISWSDMFGVSKGESADILIRSAQTKTLPDPYVIEKLLSIFGDGERYNEVMGMLMENNQTLKTNMETALLRKEMEQEKNVAVEQEKKKSEEKIKGRDMVNNEVAKLIGQL